MGIKSKKEQQGERKRNISCQKDPVKKTFSFNTEEIGNM